MINYANNIEALTFREGVYSDDRGKRYFLYEELILANDSHNLIASVCEAGGGDTISNSTCIQIQFRACDRFEELLNELSGSGKRIRAL